MVRSIGLAGMVAALVLYPPPEPHSRRRTPSRATPVS